MNIFEAYDDWRLDPRNNVMLFDDNNFDNFEVFFKEYLDSHSVTKVLCEMAWQTYINIPIEEI